ncbi:DUF420 domain-containing protein [Halopenitus sp. H-Gu1]|uniref:DUF420 domain-containing protein n=1 Tax=Halopenitus sp. H-Gu1 TaxID=3242697 RepID=UPI00359E534D
MALRLRDHVPFSTAVLSILALMLVFGAATQSIPTTYVPHPGSTVLSVIPHLNAGLSLAAIATISLGWRAIRNGQIRRHRALMGLSTLLFGSFLVGYLWRLTLLGTAEFPGPEAYHTYLYLPLLLVHIVLAIVCIPLVFYALLSAITRPVSQIPETSHPRIGRIAASLWMISFAMGVGVYVLLYHAF